MQRNNSPKTSCSEIHSNYSRFWVVLSYTAYHMPHMIYHFYISQVHSIVSWNHEGSSLPKFVPGNWKKFWNKFDGSSTGFIIIKWRSYLVSRVLRSFQGWFWDWSLDLSLNEFERYLVWFGFSGGSICALSMYSFFGFLSFDFFSL